MTIVSSLREIDSYTEIAGIPVFVDGFGTLYKKHHIPNRYETIAEENSLGIKKEHLYTGHRFYCQEAKYNVCIIGKVLNVAVGFIIKDDCLEKATNMRIIKDIELLEISMVENPINPDCYIK